MVRGCPQGVGQAAILAPWGPLEKPGLMVLSGTCKERMEVSREPWRLCGSHGGLDRLRSEATDMKAPIVRERGSAPMAL